MCCRKPGPRAVLADRSTIMPRRFVILVAVVLVGGAACIALARAKQRAELLGCGNSMVAVCFAGRMWAIDNGDRFPPDLLSMSNEVISPKILICPGDHTRKPSVSWASFTPDQSSFEMVTPSL